MQLERCYLVQDRETCQFLGLDQDGDMSLVTLLSRAFRFDNAEEAALNGLALCSEGYIIFFCFVETEVA